MKIENLETAVRYKVRRENLLKIKEIIERCPSSVVVEVREGVFGNGMREEVQDDCLSAIIHKYCEDTIALIEKNIEHL